MAAVAFGRAHAAGKGTRRRLSCTTMETIVRTTSQVACGLGHRCNGRPADSPMQPRTHNDDCRVVWPAFAIASQSAVASECNLSECLMLSAPRARHLYFSTTAAAVARNNVIGICCKRIAGVTFAAICVQHMHGLTAPNQLLYVVWHSNGHAHVTAYTGTFMPLS